MITNPVDYYNALQQIKDLNKPQYALLLPTDEKIYEIDLSTREIKAPKFLSLHTDHYAETIYFKVDRFYDNMDLADTVCTIQYLNDGVKKLTGEADTGRMYLVPFFDITTFKEEGKMLIPWQISGEVARAAGNITFSVRFFKLADNKKDYLYSINTSPATSKILIGMDLNLTDKNQDNFYVPADQVSEIYSRIDELSKQIDLYWVEVENI